MPSVLRVGQAISDIALATRGIVAGSGTATSEMRLTMIDIVDSALKVYPTIVPTLFVDDLSGEKDGDDDEAIYGELAGFTRMVSIRIASDGMEVNRIKSLVSASHPSLAAKITVALGENAFTVHQRVKSLGVGLAAGTKRNTIVQNKRTKQFRKRLPRYRLLKRAKVDTARLVRTGGIAAMTHGNHAMGVSPSALMRQRRAASSAVATGEGTGGQELEMTMIVADASLKGRADPAFPAHTEVVQHWAQAVWNGWVPRFLLQKSLEHARHRIVESKNKWSVVYGPAAALICTLERVGWQVLITTELVSHEGRRIDLLLDPPIVVARLMDDAVRAWRWRILAAAHSTLPEAGANIAPVLKLLSVKNKEADWDPSLQVP